MSFCSFSKVNFPKLILWSSLLFSSLRLMVFNLDACSGSKAYISLPILSRVRASSMFACSYARIMSSYSLLIKTFEFGFG